MAVSFKDLHNYFDEEGRTVLKEGVSSWHALKRHESWEHWLNVGRAIARAQDAAREATGVEAGAPFNAFMARCYEMPSYLGEFAEIDKSTRSYAVKCFRHKAEIEALRQRLGQDQALKLNHPKVMWQAFDRSRRPSEKDDQPKSESAFAKTKRELAAALEEIDRQKKANGGEVSFSYKDSDDNIALVLVEGLGDRITRVLQAIQRLRGKREKKDAA